MQPERGGRARSHGAEPCAILVITSVHPSSDVRIFHKECRSLASFGFDVTLLAPEDGGRVENGVWVRGVGRPRSRWHRITWLQVRLLREAIRVHPDIVHLHDPELIPIGLLLKTRGIRVVYDAHEDLPIQVMHKKYLPIAIRPLVRAAARVLLRLVGASFDLVVAASPEVARRFPPRKTIVARNYPLLEEFQETAGTEAPSAGRFVYVGAVTETRGAREMASAVVGLSSTLDITLELAGIVQGRGLLEDLSRLPAVHVLGQQDRPSLQRLFRRGSAGLALLHPLPNYMDGLPTKLYEYMAAGLPVIGSNFPKWRSAIEDCGCGLTVDPLEPDEIAAAMRWIIEHPAEAREMGRRGREAALAAFSWERESVSLREGIERILSSEPRLP